MGYIGQEWCGFFVLDASLNGREREMCLLRVFIANVSVSSEPFWNTRHQRPTASSFALHHILWPHIMNSTILVSWFLFLIVTPEFGVAYLPGSISSSEINRRSRVVLSALTRDVNGAVHAPPSEAASGGGKSEYVRDNISGMT